MPILQKRKVQFTDELKTHGTKQVKLSKDLDNSSSSDSESGCETELGKVQKYSSSSDTSDSESGCETKLGKVQKFYSGSGTSDSESGCETNNKIGQVQKHSSSSESESESETIKNKIRPKEKKNHTSSESESEDETPKNKNSSKKQSILKNESPKKFCDTPTSMINDKTLNADKGLKNTKETGNKNVESTHSDSDEQQLVIDEDDDDDLLGVQKYMRDELGLNISSPPKAKLQHGAPQSMHDPKNESSCQESKRKQLGLNISSPKKTKLKHGASQSMHDPKNESLHKESKRKNVDKGAKSKKDVNKSSNNVSSNSESESDVEGTQETVNTNNSRQNKKNMNKKLDNASSESKSDSQKMQNKDFKMVKDANYNEGVNESSNRLDSESESDIEGTQEIVIKKSYKKVTDCTKKHSNENVKTIISESDSDSDSDVGETQKSAVTKNYIKDAKMKNGTNKRSLTLESESDSGEELETKNTKSVPKVGSKIKNNQISKVVSSDSESDPETQFDEIQKALKNEFNSPRINHDMRMLGKTNKVHNSDLNDTLKKTKKKTRTLPRKAPLPAAEEKSENELSSENDTTHEQTSSDTDAGKLKTDAKVRKASASKNIRLNSSKKAPAAAKKKRQSNDSEPEKEEDEVSSDDSADEEDLNESLLHSTEHTYQPTVQEKRRLASIDIQMKHKVLPQHKVESTAGTRTLKQREKNEFEEYATLKRGTFDSTEDKQIKKNWKSFCKDHEWDPKNPKPFLLMKIKNKEALMSQVNRKRFMQILANGLPNRSLYSVFQRFKNLYDPHRTCRYTNEEDRVMVDFISTYNAVDKKDRKFAELAVILKRTRASVWRRYRVLKNKQLVGDSLCHSSK